MPVWGRAAAAAALLMLAIVCWRHRRAASGSASFVQILGLILTTTVMVAPKAAPYNQVLLLPGVLIILQHWQVFAGKGILLRAAAWSCALLVLWPWLAALALALASLFLPAPSVREAWALPIYCSFVTSIAIFLMMAYVSRKNSPNVQ